MPELVALQTMLPQIESPFAAQAKALQLRQLMGASQDADYERQLRAQAAQDDASYRQALQANPKGGEGLLSALAGAGNVKGYATAQKADLDARKATSDIGKTDVETKAKQLDTLIKANGLIGSAAGALKANPTFDNATAIVGQLRQSVGPELSAQLGLDNLQIPQDPAAITQWAQQHYLAAIDADKQLADARTAFEGNANRGVQTANSIRSAASSKYAADSSASTARARLNYDKEKDAGSEDAALDPLSVRTIAQQYLAGDNTALGNIGRGTQGAKNISAVRNEISRQVNAQGLNGADIAAKIAEFGGLKAGNRTLGTRTANIEIAASEAAELAPLALEASAKVARSGLLPFGKAQIMFDTQTNDPNLRQFAMANTALANAYGQVMSRGGVATVSDKEHAKELLSTAFDQKSYAAAVEQLQAEIRAAQKAPGTVRKEMSAAASGRAGGHDAKPKDKAPGGVIDFGSLK